MTEKNIKKEAPEGASFELENERENV